MSHAIQRARERYYLTLTPRDLYYLERQIYTGQARRVLELQRGRALYLVETRDGYRLYAMVKAGCRQILTFLSPQQVRERKERMMSSLGTLTGNLSLDVEAVIETEGDGYALYSPDDPTARFSGETVTAAFMRLVTHRLTTGEFEFVDA